MSVQERRQQPVRTKDTAAIGARDAYRNRLAGILPGQQLVLQTDFAATQNGSASSSIRAINDFFARTYSGAPGSVTRVAFSQDCAAVEMLVTTRIMPHDNHPSRLGIIFDLNTNTCFIATAKKDEPLLQKDKDGKVTGIPLKTAIPNEVLSDLTRLVGIANGQETTTFVSEESLIKEEETNPAA